MSDWREFFKNKNVTQMGLGLLGRGVGDADFLSKYCEQVLVTDLKKKDELKPSLNKLVGRANIKFVLGGHRAEDFKDRDFILKAAGVPLDSVYISEARKNNIPIEMDASLFAKLIPSGVKIIGVTGTRGKSTTTALIYEILRRAGKRVFMGGNIKNDATLPLLEKVSDGDYVVLELDSWQLQGFGEAGISPHIAIFTNFMPDHMNYYGSTGLTTSEAMDRYFEDKANIFKFQTDKDHLVIGEDAHKLVRKHSKSNVRVVKKEDMVEGFSIVVGEHNLLNMAYAREVARILKIPPPIYVSVFKTFRNLPGRLQPIKSYRGITIYNDTNATTPDATIAALRALGSGKNIILIMGGSDKNLDMSGLMEEIPKHCKAVILLPGTGSDKLRAWSLELEALGKLGLLSVKIGVPVYGVKELKEGVERAVAEISSSGDAVLFSPAFASFGPPPGGFKNEYDRGEQFVKIVRSLD